LEFHWSTFILEIINFLILVWILKYFLYKPVLKIIEQRKTGIRNDLDEAQSLRDESLLLKQQYENRQQEWQQEKQLSRKKLHEELALEREQLIKDLNCSLEQERQKSQVLEERQLNDTVKIAQQQVLNNGARFTAMLLSRLADSELGTALENRLFTMLLENLASLPEERLEMLRTAAVEKDQTVKIISSNELNPVDRKKLEDALYRVIATRPIYEYQQDPKLLAGLRIVLGSWILHANLQDELQFFSESLHE